jgi:DNA-directed RNA polymerase subunit RPC12/RpoP
MERHDTPVTFSPDEAQKIRRTLAAADMELRCPRCGSDLVIRGPVGGGGSDRSVWEVRCPPCLRSLYISDPRDSQHQKSEDV